MPAKLLAVARRPDGLRDKQHVDQNIPTLKLYYLTSGRQRPHQTATKYDQTQKCHIIKLKTKINLLTIVTYHCHHQSPKSSKQIKIRDYHYIDHLLYNKRFGFRSKRSTVQAVMELYVDILQSFDNTQVTIATFLDLSRLLILSIIILY